MKKALLSIIIMLLISFCIFPIQESFYYGHSNTASGEAEEKDDDALRLTEHVEINYARHNKRVKIERYVKVIDRITANTAVVFHMTEFNNTGLLNETIKRDYSGEDPVSINL